MAEANGQAMRSGLGAERTRALVMRLVSPVHAALYGLSGGRLLGSFRVSGGERTRMLLLVTRGRLSRKRRVTPLLYIPDGADLVVVGSAGGASQHPGWYVNLRAAGEGIVQVGSDRLRVRARTAEGARRSRLWRRLLEVYPGYAEYQERTDRRIPVVILTPTPRTPAAIPERMASAAQNGTPTSTTPSIG